MTRRLRFLLAAIILAATFDAQAIPLFSRKYNIPCSACHSVDMKLSPFGADFDLNAYQLPGTVESTPVWQQPTPPFCILAQTRASFADLKSTPSRPTDSSELYFDWLTANIISSGVLARHLSYIAEFDVEANVTNGEMLAALEYAFLDVNNLQKLLGFDQGKLNIRFGKMRPEVAIEVAPEFYSAPYAKYKTSQYLIYSYPLLTSALDQTFWLGMAHYSAELQGQLALPGVSPTVNLAWMGGTFGEVDFTAAHVLYGRGTVDLPIPGMPVTLAGTFISGSQGIDPAVKSPLVNTTSGWGADIFVPMPNGGPLALYGAYMHFDRSNTNLSPGGAAVPELADGAFVEVNAMLVPEVFEVQARFDALKRTQSTAQYTEAVNQFTVTGRYFFLPNANLFLEADSQTLDRSTSGVKTSVATLVVSTGLFLGL